MANYLRQMTKDVEIYKASKCYNGYTLFAPSFQNTTAWLIDMEGNVCHHWEMKNPAGLNYHLLPNGNLMWLGRGEGRLEGLAAAATEIIEVDWDGNEVWRYDDNKLHHDFMVKDNGNIMILRHEPLPENIRKRLKGGVAGTEINGKITYGVQIREINRKKETLWEWNMWDHFDPEKDLECPFCDRAVWGYTNSIDVFPNGDPIISVRRMNKVIRISKETGKIIWEWGPKNHLGHQHDVSVLPDGNITIFDNGTHRTIATPGVDHIATAVFTASRAIEVDPKTNKIVWEYIDPTHEMSSHSMGGLQKLPNNNYLVCNSGAGIFYEITKDKEVVWKYTSPFSMRVGNNLSFGLKIAKSIFQAHRYSPDFEGLKGKDLNPEQYEWVIKRKDKKATIEEDKVLERLAKAGY